MCPGVGPLGDINACVWNLEKGYRGTCFQGRNREADVKNWCVDPARRGDDEPRESYWDIYIFVCNLDIEGEAGIQHRELSLLLCDDLEEWDGGGGREGDWKGGGYMYTCGGSSLLCSRK